MSKSRYKISYFGSPYVGGGYVDLIKPSMFPYYGLQNVAQANTNTNTIISQGADQTGEILANGTVPFAANESMGGFRLTNVGDPIVDTDAATKDYVDDHIPPILPNGGKYDGNIHWTTNHTHTAQKYIVNADTLTIDAGVLVLPDANDYANIIYAKTLVMGAGAKIKCWVGPTPTGGAAAGGAGTGGAGGNGGRSIGVTIVVCETLNMDPTAEIGGGEAGKDGASGAGATHSAIAGNPGLPGQISGSFGQSYISDMVGGTGSKPINGNINGSNNGDYAATGGAAINPAVLSFDNWLNALRDVRAFIYNAQMGRNGGGQRFDPIKWLCYSAAGGASGWITDGTHGGHAPGGCGGSSAGFIDPGIDGTTTGPDTNGGSDTTTVATGGGGGGGGGWGGLTIVVVTRKIISAGIIGAAGGNGGKGGNGALNNAAVAPIPPAGGGGGGAPGNGGILYYFGPTGPTLTVAAGAPGISGSGAPTGGDTPATPGSGTAGYLFDCSWDVED